MKVTGGSARGSRLSSSNKTDIRPASDQMRQAVFSSLGQDCSGLYVLDLFAGTGSYGLEALSRGAKGAHFVEKDRQHILLIKDNLAKVCKSAQLDPQVSKIFKADAIKWLRTTKSQYDLIFVDPPYPLIDTLWPALIEALSPMLVGEKTKMIFEMPGEFPGHDPRLSLLKHLGSSKGQAPSCRIYQGNKKQ